MGRSENRGKEDSDDRVVDGSPAEALGPNKELSVENALLNITD